MWDISIAVMANFSASITAEGFRQKIEPTVREANPKYDVEELAVLLPK